MTDREKYQRAFRSVRPSRDIYTEVLTMTTKKRKLSKALVSVCAAVILVIAGATAAYAADFGGFRQMVTMWIRGERQAVMVEQVDEGQFEWTDENGESYEGGGWVEDENGGRAVTLDEWAEQMANEPLAEMDENGRVWFCYRDYKEDITDQVANDGIAHVKVERDGEPCYVSIKDNHGGGYAINMRDDGFDDEFYEDGEYPEGGETVHTIEAELE